MIPSTWTGLLLVLVCLLPGAVWELKRAEYEPSLKESALLEATRIMLASFCSVGPAAALILFGAWVVAAVQRSIPSSGVTLLSRWLREPWANYAVPLSAALIGCVFVVVRARWKWRSAPRAMRAGGTWFRSFVEIVPKTTTPYLTVELDDGTVWRGRLLGFDSDPEDAHRNLALKAPLWRKRPEASEFLKREAQAVVLPEFRIRSIQARYIGPDSQPDSESTAADQAPVTVSSP